MDVQLEKSQLEDKQIIYVSGSKSETNRMLVLQALYPDLIIENVSDSDDSILMKKCLNSRSPLKDVHHAGTAMRFLTSYYSSREGQEVTLTGSDRMKERPLYVLVNALRQLGADITYLEKEGYPPVKIKGKSLVGHKVELNAHVSSQYISSLMLIAPALPEGLEIHLKGQVTSFPYIQMTMNMLMFIGVDVCFNNDILHILPLRNCAVTCFQVESDWSSASYFYSFIALSAVGTSVELNYFKEDSLQGDAFLAEIYKDFGVKTVFRNHTAVLQKFRNPSKFHLEYDLNDTPDIAQTIAVTCLGLGITCKLTGLHTLKIKETDRLQAMKNELQKFGTIVVIDEETLSISGKVSVFPEDIEVATYNDHRMALAFAPLSLKTRLKIKEAQVVGKSFPGFWADLKKLGVKMSYV